MPRYNKYSRKQDLQINDILFVKDGDNKIGQTAMILSAADKKIIVQSHFLKIRALSIDPFLVFWMLNSPIVKSQIRLLVFNQSTLSTIGDRINNIMLPLPTDAKVKDRLIEKIKNIMITRNKLAISLRESYKAL